jgi:MFS family permease
LSRPVSAPRSGGVYPYVVVGLLGLVYALNFLDRQILAILAEPIRQDIGLSDTQIGALSGFAFAVFYTLCGVPVGWLADRVPRVWIMGAACALWSCFTMACGAAANFAQLALARIGVAVGEAGGAPPAYSLISDYFPPKGRGAALAIFSAGGPLGVLLGTALGATVAAHHGWRWAFVAAGAPGLAAALILLAVVREPRRGALDGPTGEDLLTVEPPPSLGAAISGYFASRTLRWVTLATALSAFVGYGASAWTAPFLMRVKGVSLMELALYYSAAVGAVSVLGTFASGWLVDRLAARDARWYSWMPGVAFAAMIPFWLLMLWIPGWRMALAVNSVSALLLCFYLAPAIAVVQNATPANRRTIAGAILLFVVNLFGLGGGPLFIGLVSDAAKAGFGASSLTVGLLMLTPVMALASLAQFAAAAAGARDRRDAAALSPAT